MPSPLLGHLDLSADGRLSVRLDNGQTLSLSAEHVYGPATPGTSTRVFIVSQSSDGIGDETLSHAMINELLHPSAA